MPISHRLAGLALAGALASLPVSPTYAETARTEPLVEPVVLLENGQIRACGLGVTFAGHATATRFELLVRREGRSAMLTVRADCAIEIERAEGTPETASANRIVVPRPTIETRSFSTASMMRGEPARNGAFAELTTPADNDSIATLIQELMIGGGRFGCLRRPSAPTPMRTVAGPLPQQVRAAYLNCSGDLFRPEEEKGQ